MANGQIPNGITGTNGSNGYTNGSHGSAARWQITVSAAAVMTAVGGALLTLLMNITSLENTATNLSTRVSALESLTAAAADAQMSSRTDMAAIRRDLVQIDTQLCAEDTMWNLMRADDLRDFAMLWAKTMGGELPITNAYHPPTGMCAGLASR